MSCGCETIPPCDDNSVCGNGCNPCAPSSTTGATGPQGQTGATGAAGTNGVNAFTSLTANFTQPIVGGTVVASVGNSTWISLNQNVFVVGGGYYKATALPSSTQVTLQNLGVTGNAAPTATVSNGSKVSPSGAPGPDLVSPLPIASGGTGQATANAAFGALSPMTTNGDLITRAGGAASRVGIGSAGQVLTVAGGAPTWATNAPAAANITGQVAIANGGTGASTAAGARTNLDVSRLSGGVNTFTNFNNFNLTGGRFLNIYTGAQTLFQVSDTLGVVAYNSAGSRELNLDNGFLKGGFSNSTLLYVNANSSTYTVPAVSVSSNVETVISTYSLTGTQTITLPAGTDGRVVRITDGTGNASVNPISIIRSGSDTILGGTSYTLNLNYGAVAFIFLNSTNNWVILP